MGPSAKERTFAHNKNRPNTSAMIITQTMNQILAPSDLLAHHPTFFFSSIKFYSPFKGTLMFFSNNVLPKSADKVPLTRILMVLP